MLTTSASDYVRLSPLEIAMGVPLEATSACLPEEEVRPSSGDARGALRTVLARLLTTGPVFVSFSGGRDSSAVLAVAVSVAREYGLPLPVPVTYRYPGVAGAAESEWQDLVLAHLGTTERLQVDITGQQRLLGQQARAGMAERGLVWPASANLQHELFSRVRGGTLLTGEGGDEVLSGRRSAPVARVLRTVRRRRRPSGEMLRHAVRALEPQPRISVERARRVQQTSAPWLRGAGRERFVELISKDVSEPLRWDRATHQMAVRPLARMIFHNVGLVAREYGVRLEHPLLAPEFIGAWMADGGWWGFTGRTASMRFLFADVLPEPVLSRSSKAWFNESRIGEVEREFARRWDGAGLDPDVVDAEVLRQAWLAEEPGGRMDVALMAAWMAVEGLPLAGSRA